MTTDIGQITAAATCAHCDGPTDRHCPTSPVAVPAPGTIVETGN